MTPAHSRPLYICIEGIDDVGKTAQCNLVTNMLRDAGFHVLQANEPGTPAVPLTMELRRYMMSKEHDHMMTDFSRECLYHAIRSIHLKQIIFPELDDNRSGYDFIIQDRGILSGFALAADFGYNMNLVKGMAAECVNAQSRNLKSALDVYDQIFLLVDNDLESLRGRREMRLQELGYGTVKIEDSTVSSMGTMQTYMKNFQMDGPITIIETTGRTEGDVSVEIYQHLCVLRDSLRKNVNLQHRS